MSARNGDKARFGKQRKRKMAHRARTQELREGLKPVAAGAAVAEGAETAHGEHHGVLDSAAGALGSVIGSVAAKVKHVTKPEPATAE